MLRIALRATDREYEIDHWTRYADSLDEAKTKAQIHATKTGQGTLSWKVNGGAVVASLGRNLGYYIERHHDNPESSTQSSSTSIAGN